MRSFALLTSLSVALLVAGCGESPSPVAPQAATDIPTPVDVQAAADASAEADAQAGEAGAQRDQAGAQTDTESPEDQPRFIAYDTAPVLQNREVVARRIEELYPPRLREAGVGGVVNVWLYISETGVVEETEVNRSSGVDELDAAATTLAKDMVFRPAANAGEPVGVWVSIPISFSRSR